MRSLLCDTLLATSLLASERPSHQPLAEVARSACLESHRRLAHEHAQHAECSNPEKMIDAPADAGLSDSDTSDSEGTLGTGDRLRSSKARLAALLCLQTLARVDGKALQASWPILLPSYSVTALRPQDATLIDVLLSDPSAKVLNGFSKLHTDTKSTLAMPS